MDVLSDLLDDLDLTGSLYYSTCFLDPWSIEMPSEAEVCRFHAVTQGACYITVPETGDSALAAKGDLVLVPHGSSHTLQSTAEEPPRPLAQVLDEAQPTEDGCLHWGGDGPATRLVCGFFAFDRDSAHPLLASLPALIHVQASPEYDVGWIESLTRFIGQEAGSGHPGSKAVCRRLSEVLFIQVLRHLAAVSPDAIPLLAGIAHPQLGRALRAMHSRPEEAWTVDDLAREAALSRTAFAQKFHRRVGQTPFEYLTRLRMERARRLLKGDRSSAAVGEAVGYRSEAAFHRAFRRRYGVGPGAYRRRRSTPRQDAAPTS